MRLLLTRSASDAARTREKLEAMGHVVFISPVIDTVGTGAPWPSGVVDAVVATSAQAFTVSIDGPSPEARRLLTLFVVGNRTLEAAKAAGFAGASTAAPTAAALADMISWLAERPRRMVYLAGRARKPDLETELGEMGQSFDVIEVYDAQAVEALDPETTAAFDENAIDGVLHFSRRSAELFVSAARGADVAFRRAAHFCLSEDVAAPLQEAGCPTIHVARAPNEAELLALVAASGPTRA